MKLSVAIICSLVTGSFASSYLRSNLKQFVEKFHQRQPVFPPRQTTASASLECNSSRAQFNTVECANAVAASSQPKRPNLVDSESDTSSLEVQNESTIVTHKKSDSKSPIDQFGKLTVIQTNLRDITAGQIVNNLAQNVEKPTKTSDSRSALAKWVSVLLSDKTYMANYFQATGLDAMIKDCTVDYLNVEVAPNILLVTAEGKPKYILKVLTTFEYFNEVDIQPTLACINSRYFPKLYHVTLNDSLISGECNSILMEFIDSQDLFTYYTTKKLRREEKRFVVAQMIFTVHLLHENLIMHRDVKPENFLLDRNHAVKLIDFSYSKLAKTKDEEFGFYVGTKGFMAPEVRSRKYTIKCDWYSLGVTLFELFTNFNVKSNLLEKKKVESLLHIRSWKERDLVFNFLLEENLRLCEYEEIKKQPYFAGFDWSDVESEEMPNICHRST